MSARALHVARHARMPLPHVARPLIALVFEGLSEARKQLPSTLLYDADGARLFERACAQPEYYVARAEAEILQRHGRDLGQCLGPGAAVVDYGAGAGRAGAALLASLPRPAAYVPIDVEATQLARAQADVLARLGALPVHPLCQDLHEFVSLPAEVAGARRRVALLAGGIVGAVRPLEMVAHLNTVREAMGPHGALLAGVDLLAQPASHEAAYRDRAGAMAAFNRNVLVRLNRDIDATFAPEAFDHRVAWNADLQRIEMSLLSTQAQVPRIAGIGIPLAAGEDIVTLLSHKYTLEGFASLARIAGWSARHAWLDDEGRYALQYLEAGEP